MVTFLYLNISAPFNESHKRFRYSLCYEELQMLKNILILVLFRNHLRF
jgi:hypothetical protein